MSERAETIKDFARMGFDHLGRATKELKPEQLDWRSCSEANTVRWILTHVTNMTQVYIPRVLKGEMSYWPNGWPKDYVGNSSYSLEKILGDLERGEADTMRNLEGLTDASLEEEIDFWGKRKRGQALMMLVSEIHHHEGQVAAILGLEKRMKGAQKA